LSAVTLLAAGIKADVGVSATVDVTGHALLKLTATLRANLGKAPQLQLTVETGVAAAGPFRELYTQHFSASNWPSDNTTRIVVAPDNFCRVRWSGGATANVGNAGNSSNDVTGEFNLAVVGVGIPDAP